MSVVEQDTLDDGPQTLIWVYGGHESGMEWPAQGPAHMIPGTRSFIQRPMDGFDKTLFPLPVTLLSLSPSALSPPPKPFFLLGHT